MSGDRQPRLRDRVRWTSVVEGVVEYIDDKTIYINDDGDDPDGNVCVLSMVGATVEVLEPADDPSKPCGRSGTAGSSRPGPFIGAVPGTAAAEQHIVPPQVLARVREMLANGQKVRAIKAIREAAVGLGLKEAKVYAESLPEWHVAERVAKERLREAVLGDDRREPRVFKSDGPEPPDDVTVLEKVDYPENRGFPFTKRGAYGWTNCETPDDDTSNVHGFKWPPGYDLTFREVTA